MRPVVDCCAHDVSARGRTQSSTARSYLPSDPLHHRANPAPVLPAGPLRAHLRLSRAYRVGVLQRLPHRAQAQAGRGLGVMRRAEAVDFMTADDRTSDACAAGGDAACQAGFVGSAFADSDGYTAVPPGVRRAMLIHGGCTLSSGRDTFSEPHRMAVGTVTPNRSQTITCGQGAAAMCPDGLGNRAGFGEEST